MTLRSRIEALVNGKISPAIDINVVYRCLFLKEQPVRGHEVYCDAESFFSLTYVTPRFREYLEDFLRRLAQGESAIYLMPALLGAGKSHFLAFVLHLISLYDACKGSGQCVGQRLRSYGIDLNTPDIRRVPKVAVFRALSKLGLFEHTLRGARDKEGLRRIIESQLPLVILFDETQYFEERERDFVQWMQSLAEVARELDGVYLFVSYSLFSEDKPQLERPRSMQVVERMAPIRVSLDTVNNIVHVFRRWASLQVAKVDTAPLKDFVKDEELRLFERQLGETYPFNPVFLNAVVRLADESLAERTKVQLTRELLRILARAYLAAENKLVTFAHLPEPEEIIATGGVEAVYWKKLLDLYKEDVGKLSQEGKGEAAVSVLRHILLATFLARLLPSEVLYPTEGELILGSYNGRDVKPLDVRMVLDKIGEAGVHVAKLGNRYLYWFIGDELAAIRQAMDKFSDSDGLEVVAVTLREVLSKRAGLFDKILISGITSEGSGKLKIVNDRDAWFKELEDSDLSVLAVDVMGFGVAKRRNNLFYVKPAERADIPDELRARLEKIVKAKDLKDAVVLLGRFYKAAEEVRSNLRLYFPDLLSSEGDERIKAELEKLLEDRIQRWRDEAYVILSRALNHWLTRAFYGHSEKSATLDKHLTEISRLRDEFRPKIAKIVLEDVFDVWDGFKKVGDLWSLYLNNEKMPAAPVSFGDFVKLLEEACTGCGCVFEVEGRLHWLSEGGCETPKLDKNVGVAPVEYKGQFNRWAVEAFLRQLAGESASDKRYFVVYKRPTGEEVKESVDDLLASREEWPYLFDGKVVVERREKYITVLIDGVDTSPVERKPGAKLTVEVRSAEELTSVRYRLLDAFGRIVEKNDAGHLEMLVGEGYVGRIFKIETPKVPGVYKLEVEAEFASGGRDARTITLVVKGRCRKEVPKMSVGVGDRLRRIDILDVNTAEDIVTYLAGRKLGFRFELSTKKAGPQTDDELSVDARINKAQEKIQSIRRLLRTLGEFTRSVEARVLFNEPVQVDEDMVQKFRGYSLGFGVEVEEEC